MIRMSAVLREEHERILTEYLRGEQRLTRKQWNLLREAIDLLAQSTVTFQDREYTFAKFYDAFIDSQFADPFLLALTATSEVGPDAPRLQADSARQIVQWLRGQELYQLKDLGCRLLLTFCLYRWAAFAVGYAFEWEIIRDLRAAGIGFTCHDLTQRHERMSAYDLAVLGLRGDVKYSTYFLTVAGARTEGVDFFITRLYDETGARWFQVVLLTPAAWDLIDGETSRASWHEAGSPLPGPVTVTVAGRAWVLAPYEGWKERVLRRQRTERQ